MCTIAHWHAPQLRVWARPYPPFDNSDTVAVTRLGFVGESHTKQQAELVTVAVLSNGATLDMSVHPDLQHSPIPGGLQVTGADGAPSNRITRTSSVCVGRLFASLVGGHTERLCVR